MRSCPPPRRTTTERDKRLNNRPTNQSRSTMVGKAVGKNLLVPLCLYIYIYEYQQTRIAQAFRVLFIRGSESSIIRQIGRRSCRHETLTGFWFATDRDNFVLSHFRLLSYFRASPFFPPPASWNPGYQGRRLISFRRKVTATNIRFVGPVERTYDSETKYLKREKKV